MAQAPDANTPPARPTATGRLESIDALRGFDMFCIIGGDALARAIARRAGEPTGGLIQTQTEHVAWEGFHFEDLIFPLFLFLVGAVIPFSQAKIRKRGEPLSASYWRIVRRVLLLFALGLICNGLLKFDFDHWKNALDNCRVAGVLQRIAICYGAAALVVLHTGIRGQAAAVVAILLGYWGLFAFVAAPGSSPGDYSVEGNLAGWIDRHYLPGKIMPEYYGYGDNEGLLSTLPAVATTLIGALAGQWLRAGFPAGARLLGLTTAGLVSLLVGYAWGLSMPIIKNLWTSSFVLVAAGWSLLLLAAFHAVIDVAGLRRWAFFFTVIGANAIVAFVAPRFIDFRHAAEFFLGGAARHAGSYGPILLIAGSLAAKWLFLLYLYRNRIFLRV